MDDNDDDEVPAAVVVDGGGGEEEETEGGEAENDRGSELTDNDEEEDEKGDDDDTLLYDIPCLPGTSVTPDVEQRLATLLAKLDNANACIAKLKELQAECALGIKKQASGVREAQGEILVLLVENEVGALKVSDALDIRVVPKPLPRVSRVMLLRKMEKSIAERNEAILKQMQIEEMKKVEETIDEEIRDKSNEMYIQWMEECTANFRVNKPQLNYKLVLKKKKEETTATASGRGRGKGRGRGRGRGGGGCGARDGDGVAETSGGGDDNNDDDDDDTGSVTVSVRSTTTTSSSRGIGGAARGGWRGKRTRGGGAGVGPKRPRASNSVSATVYPGK